MDKKLGDDFFQAARNVRMGRARYTDPFSRQTFFVYIPGTKHEARDIPYEENRHRQGTLSCECCNARLRFRPSQDSAIAGSSLKGNRATFVTETGDRHDLSCKNYTEPKTGRRQNIIDRAKGFRIHINTAEFSDLYTKVEGVYRRKGAITEVLDEDLKSREIRTVRSVSDIVHLMQTEKPERLIDSKVIFGNVAIAWKEFFVRYNHKGKDQPRFTGLVERLENEGRGAQAVCLMEMDVAKPGVINPFARGRLSIYSRRIAYKQTDEGFREDIVPSVTLDREAARHNTAVAGAFSWGRHYLVLGLVSLNKIEDGPYYLNIAVTDARQVSAVNIENVARDVQNKWKNPPAAAPESSLK